MTDYISADHNAQYYKDAPDLIRRFDAVIKRMTHAAGKATEKSEAKIILPDLVAVSKFHPAESVAIVAKHWSERRNAEGDKIPQPCFGENYVQEALAKQQDVESIVPGVLTLPDAWHFTGHLQSNKAKEIIGHFGLVQTINSERLAHFLHEKITKNPHAKQRVLIQVNIGEEAQKSGAMPHDVLPLAKVITALSGLKLEGLMCLPPDVDSAEESRPYFSNMRQLRDRLCEELCIELPCLSMGMSGDLEVAIEEGATMIRVGTDIFGPRPNFL